MEIQEIATRSLQELMTFVKEISPHLWDIMVRQAYAEAISNIFISIILLVMGYFTYKLVKNTHNNFDWDGFDPAIITFGTLGVTIMGIAFITLMQRAIMMLINPHYYAIVMLLESAGKLSQ